MPVDIPMSHHHARIKCSPSSAIVGFCTDVEGDFDFWNRYVSISQVLSRDTHSGRLQLADGAHFVFGGDSVDWGSGDLEFLRELLDLHDR